jgi:LDH2 family malate/lactate/ureidoglycolate dehydrogenase
LIAFDISSFTDLEIFKTNVSQMCRTIRREKPAHGFDKVQIPGDRGMDKLKQAWEKGTIEVDNQLLSDLSAIVNGNLPA